MPPHNTQTWNTVDQGKELFNLKLLTLWTPIHSTRAEILLLQSSTCGMVFDYSTVSMETTHSFQEGAGKGICDPTDKISRMSSHYIVKNTAKQDQSHGHSFSDLNGNGGKIRFLQSWKSDDEQNMTLIIVSCFLSNAICRHMTHFHPLGHFNGLRTSHLGFPVTVSNYALF